MSDEGQIDRLPDVRERKQRGSAFGRVIGRLFALGVLAAVVIASAGAYVYVTMVAPGPLAAPKIINIPGNLSQADLADELEKQGVISNAMLFSAALKATDLRGRPAKAGEYSFPKEASMWDVLETMVSGKVVTYKFTIPEGFTSQMAIDRLNSLEGLSGKVTVVPPEGSMLANTFLFSRGTDPNRLVADITAQQSKLVDELWAQRPADSPLKTKEEMVTLASIVEKETGKADERPIVASVFLNRIKAGMRLQSDPTIIYGIVGGKGKLDRAITRADIDTVTPYNTYQINGLPPGPIANPGRASLEAVIKPANTNYLYFVADGSGGHAFATTLEEHNANVKRWRALEAAPPADSASESKAEANPEDAPVPGEIEAATPTVTTPGLPEVETPPAEDPAVAAAEDLQQTTDVPAPVEEKKPEGVAAADVSAAQTKSEEKQVSTRDLKKPDIEKPAEAVPDAKAEEAKKPEEPRVEEAKKPEEPKPEETKKAADKKPLVLKPGTIVEVDGKLIPIPALKKKK